MNAPGYIIKIIKTYQSFSKNSPPRMGTTASKFAKNMVLQWVVAPRMSMGKTPHAQDGGAQSGSRMKKYSTRFFIKS